MVSFAQRMRAEMVTQVREEMQSGATESAPATAEAQDDETEEEAEDDMVLPFKSGRPVGRWRGKAPPVSRPPVPAIPKQPPVFPKQPPLIDPDVLSSVAAEEQEEQDEHQSQAVTAPAAKAAASSAVPAGRGDGFAASAKKKGKAAKKHREDLQSDQGPGNPGASQSSAAAKHAAAAAVKAMQGSVLAELLAPAAWSAVEPDVRLVELTSKLPWTCPLGLSFPITWQELASLEIDCGPRSSMKRDETPVLDRVKRNGAMFVGHYVTAAFFLSILQELSRFGVLLWVFAAQGMLVLMPEGAIPQLTTSRHVLLLQAIHVLLWVLFARMAWMTHLFVKLALLVVFSGHAYIVSDAVVAD